MSGILGTFLLVWGASFVVLATALTLVVVTQGTTRHARTALARLRSARRLAGRAVTGDRTQPV